MFGYVLRGKGDVDIRAVIPPPRRLRRGGLREHTTRFVSRET